MKWSRELVIVGVVLALFVAMSALMHVYGDALRGYVAVQGARGMALYVGVTIAAVVLAPISTVPLLPVATTLWGPLTAALLSIVGWSVGAIIAFFIARTYGQPIVRRFVNVAYIERVERFIPDEHLFASLVLLRMTFPVDLLSYAIGLFTRIPFPMYFLTTVIGITPFAFVFAYAVDWPLWSQALIAALGVAIIGYGYMRYWRTDTTTHDSRS